MNKTPSVYIKKNKKLIFILLCIIWIVFIAGVLVYINSKYSAIFESKELSLNYRHCFEYNEDDLLIKHEKNAAKGKQPVYVKEYDYDINGNIIEFYLKDYESDPDILKIDYEYQNGKLVRLSSHIMSDYEYCFSYTDTNSIIATPVDDSDDIIEYRFNFDDKLISKTRIGDEEELVEYMYKYGENGEIVEFHKHKDGFGVPLLKEDYFYQYDHKGRLININMQVESGAGETREMVAEYAYEYFSDDYTVYTYNSDNELVGKYKYKHDNKGNLIEVSVYNNRSIYNQEDSFTDWNDDWGTATYDLDFNYPGGELLKYFFE